MLSSRFSINISDTSASIMETSRYCPWPVRSFSRRAARMEIAGEQGRHQVADVEPHLDRRAVGFAVDVHQAAHPLDLRVVGRLVLIRPGLPVAGNGGVDDGGVGGGDGVIAQPGAAQRTGGQVFQYHVRLFRQLQEQPFALGMFQIQGDALDALGPFQEAGGKIVVGIAAGVGALGGRRRARCRAPGRRAREFPP